MTSCCGPLCRASNPRLAACALAALRSAAGRGGEDGARDVLRGSWKEVVEALGDSKAAVRDGALELLTACATQLGAAAVTDRACGAMWAHRNWRVRAAGAVLVRTLAETLGAGNAADGVVPAKAVVPELLKLLNDSQPAPRDAAAECLEELYVHLGKPLADAVARSGARAGHKRELAARFARLAGAAGDDGGSPAGSPGPSDDRLAGSPAHRSPAVRARASAPSSHAADRARGHRAPAAAAPAPAATAPGGLLPPAAPRVVYSEKELVSELEKCFRDMLPSKDWNVRIAAMTGVEALIVGGAADAWPEALAERLREHKDVLSAQILDRRSAVMKQACHLIATTAHALAASGGFDGLADHFLAALGKCVVVTVAVMADSAHICCMALIAFCRPRCTIPRAARWALREKGVILRTRGAEYVAAALVRWAHTGECERSLDLALEIVGASADEPNAKVRGAYRDVFGAIMCGWPDVAERELSAAGAQLGRQLARVQPRESWAKAATALDSALGAGRSGKAIGASSASSRAQQEWNQYLGGGHGAKGARERPKSAHPSAHAAPQYNFDDMPVGSSARASGAGLGVPARRARPASAAVKAAPGARRVLQPGRENRQGSAAAHSAGTERRVAKAAWADNAAEGRAATARNGEGGASGMNGGAEVGVQPRSLPAALAAVSAALGGAGGWQSRASSLHSLVASLEVHAGVCSVASAERLAAALAQALQDPHQKVAAAALAAASGAARNLTVAIEAVLERILPGVLSRAADVKAPVAAAAAEALDVFRAEFSGEALLPALLRALDEQRGPRGRIAVLEFGLVALPAHSPSSRPPAGANLRQWASKVAPLAADRTPELRRAAAAALVAVYESLDASALFGALVALPAAEQSAARRAVSAYVPSLDAEIAIWARERSAGGQSSAAAATAAARESFYAHGGGTAEASPSAAYHSAHSSPAGDFESAADAGVQDAPPSRLGASSVSPGGGKNGAGFATWAVPSHARRSSRYGDDEFDEVDGLDGAAPVHDSPPKRHSPAAAVAVRPAAAAPLSPTPSSDSPPPPPPPREQSLLQRRSPAVASADMASPASCGGAPSEPVTTVTPGAATVAPSPLMPLTPPMPPLTPSAALGPDTAATAAALAAALRAPEAGERASALRQLEALLGARPPPRLEPRQAQSLLLGAVEAACPESAPNERELALTLARDMLLEHGDVTSLHSAAADAATHRLLVACRDPMREVSRAAGECLEALLGRLPAERALDTVLPIVAAGARGKNGGGPGPASYGDGASSLQAAIRSLARAVSRMRASELMPRCSAVLPPLFEAFDSQSADVRKAVVFCLVDMWVVLGDALTPHLGALSTSQLKLVTIYVNKTHQSRKQGASRR